MISLKHIFLNKSA